MKRINSMLGRLLLSGVAPLALSCPALAQDDGTSANVSGAADAAEPAGDIVVTAQKRTERLQDVPLAVTALSAEALDRQQISDTSSLTRLAPSLTFQQGVNPTASSFRIRGIGTSLFSQGVESAVSVVVDGVVLARQLQGFTDLVDVERIEVLRGPQGTLFGKNATGGVISVVTARPSTELSGEVKATVAERDEYRVSGTISGPITDTLRARVTGFYNDVGGYTPSVTLDRDVNGFESWGVRGKLEWDATEDLNLLFTAEYRKTDSECCQPVFVRTDNAILDALLSPVIAGPDNRASRANKVATNDITQSAFSLEANYDLGSATITSITAYQQYDSTNDVDVDALNTPVPIFGPAFAQFDVNGGPADVEQFTQELRIASNGDNRLNYVLGAYYLDLGVDRAFNRRIAVCSPAIPANARLAVGAPCAVPIYLSGGHTAHLSSNNYAAFGQLDYALVDGLKLIGGARLQHETITVSGTRTGQPLVAGDRPLFGAVNGTRSAADTALTGKLGLQYEFSRNAQAYATYSHGYKGQGFDTEVSADFAAQDPVRPETVDAFEIGFKGTTADRTFSIATALFLADYKDLQVQANRSDPTTGNFVFVQANAGSSQTKGFEIEATLRPAKGFTVDAALTYIDAKVDADGLNCPLQLQAAAPILTGDFPDNTCFRARTVVNGVTVTSGPQQNVRGGGLPASPRWRFNLSPRYEHEFGDWRGFVQASLSYQSDVQFAIEQDPLLVQDGYALVDVSLGGYQIGKGLSATLFVKNLFDKRYYANMGHSALSTATLAPNALVAYYTKDADRYFGVNLGYKF